MPDDPNPKDHGTHLPAANVMIGMMAVGMTILGGLGSIGYGIGYAAYRFGALSNKVDAMAEDISYVRGRIDGRQAAVTRSTIAQGAAPFAVAENCTTCPDIPEPGHSR